MELDIAQHIADLKAAGKWTPCHEVGHDLVSPDCLVCRRCGEDFEPILQELLDGAGEV